MGEPAVAAGVSPRRRAAREWRFLAAGVLVSLLWVVALTTLHTVFAPGEWLPAAMAISAATVLAACLLHALWPALRLTAALAGPLSGFLLWLGGVADAGRIAAWAQSPGEAFAEVRTVIVTGSAPLPIAGPAQDLLLFVVLLGAMISALVLVGMHGVLPSGIVVALVLLVPPAVTAQSAEGWALLAAGALLALLAWVGSPRVSGAGVLAGLVAVGVAVAAVGVAPPVRDRVWNEALLRAPVGVTVPDVTIALADDLRRRSDVGAFSFVSSLGSGALRLPLAVLADFDEGSWQPETAPDPAGRPVAEIRWPGAIPPAASAAPQRSGIAPAGWVEITILGLVSDWLPMPQSPHGAVARGSETENGFDPEAWIWSARSNTARSPQEVTRRGDRYAVATTLLMADALSREELAGIDPAAQVLFPDAAPDLLAPYLALPAPLPAALASAAEEVAGDAGSRSDVGFALQDWFRGGGFAYDESAPYVPGTDAGDPYAVMTALLAERRGFCVHYASTFAVMARHLGVPVRLAVGYATWGAGETETVVRGRELHAWPEIYLDDVGWVAFEPTPGGAGARADAGGADAADDTSADAAAETTAPEQEASAEPTPETDDPATGPGAGGEDIGATARSGGLLGLAALLVLVLLLPAAIRLARTARRRRRIARGQAPATTAWREFEDTAIDLGLLRATALPVLADGPPPSAPRARTAEAAVDHLVATGVLDAPDAAEAAAALAARATAERYGGPAVAPVPAAEAAALLARARRGLRDGTGPAARLRAAFLPRSLRPAARAR